MARQILRQVRILATDCLGCRLARGSRPLSMQYGSHILDLGSDRSGSARVAVVFGEGDQYIWLDPLAVEPEIRSEAIVR
jgi:hypothetical protein